MVGAIIFTTMSDRLGRKPVHLACQYSMFVLGIILAYAPNYISFTVIRFFLGAAREVRQARYAHYAVSGKKVPLYFCV